MTATAPPPAGEPTAADLLADPGWLATLRSKMQRFARLQLGDDGAADDAVQEALVGALTGAGRFTGRAAVRTWVFAILKNKIADQLRARRRNPLVADLAPACEADDDSLDELFVADGHWSPEAAPRDWGDPEAALDNRQFWTVLDACLDGLPPRLGRVFLMREVVGLESHEVCAELGIASGNLFVMLHRARLRLRECLDQRWFAERRPC
ncbi:sigma-70 family RNA polymerase sigma factor [Derxia lacustris]|uniref:sigma-70 family RNA polymerase sigma factor n=1 Tax=Derxia lacustris TaxID=764842 RepID=UPI000A17833A|nr:sigma-70 family RNA polymerase sigma factor [Derxia lacustris]